MSPYRPPAEVEDLRGEVLDPAFLRGVAEREGTIVSCLGLRRNSLLPWGSLRSPTDLVQVVMRRLTEMVRPDGRVLWISAGGVHDSLEQLTPLTRRVTRTGDVGVAYRDLEAAERVVRESGRSWLAVRPVTLVSGPPTGHAQPVDRYGLWSHIRRSDVAMWMLDVADGTRRCDGPSVLLGASNTKPRDRA